MTTIATGTRAFFDRTAMGLGALRARAEDLQSQMARGERLDRSSDDPLAASRLRNLARAERLAGIDSANANRAQADLALADSALSSFADAIVRAQELATQAANGTLAPGQRSAIGTELLQIHGTLMTLANARDSAGHALFGGESTGQAYTLDATGAAIYGGTARSGELPLAEGESVTRGLTGPEFLEFPVNGAPANLFAVVRSLGEALQGGVADPQVAAQDALAGLDAGLDAVTTGQTIVGTRLAWIDLVGERRTAMAELRADEQGEIGGTDIAETVAELQNVMLVLEASQASFARLANLSLFDTLR